MVTPVSDSEYRGSRKRKQRFAFKETSRAAFIELAPEHVISVDQFQQRLEGVRAVDRVEWHPKGSKAQQGNRGKHYQKHNFMVYSKLSPCTGMEFELTRNQHTKDPRRPFTISAMFKDTNEDLYLEAWRILAEACKGMELLPAWVADQYNKTLLRSMGIVPLLPGSASKQTQGSSSTTKTTNDDDEEPAESEESYVLIEESDEEKSERPAIPPAEAGPAASTGEEGIAPGSASAPEEFSPIWEGPDEENPDEQKMEDGDAADLASGAVAKENETAQEYRASQDAGVRISSSEELAKEAYPDFLQPAAVRQRPSDLRAMQELKAREMEEVRWRSTSQHPANVEFASVMTVIKSEVRQSLTAPDQTCCCDLRELTMNERRHFPEVPGVLGKHALFGFESD